MKNTQHNVRKVDTEIEKFLRMPKRLCDPVITYF